MKIAYTHQDEDIKTHMNEKLQSLNILSFRLSGRSLTKQNNNILTTDFRL